MVLKTPKNINKKAYRHREFCALVTLDVENAFNSAPWAGIIAAMRKSNISGYLIKIVQSYLKDRYILIQDDEKIEITCGVPQGSVLGPVLWNIFYDQVLRLDMERDVHLVAYADDLAIIITATCKERLEDLAREAIDMVTTKLAEMNIRVATKKTEVVILAGRRKIKNLSIATQGETIHAKTAIKYMGIYIDKDVKMTTHIKEVCKRANSTISALSRILPNIGGPRSSKRRTLMSVVTSIILYAAPVWEAGLRQKHYEDMLESVNRRMAIRITTAYRTAPTAAVLAIAKSPPIKLLVKERTAIHEKGKAFKTQARRELLEEWQRSWDRYEGHAKWFIKDIQRWYNREWGEVDHFLTQVITGHGVFGVYLKRIGKQETGKCWYCEEEDTAAHTIFNCGNWTTQRQEATEAMGKEISPEKIPELLLESENSWNIVVDMCKEIMHTKAEDERSRI